MYTTFPAGAVNGAELGQPTEAPAPQKGRRKRAQVARACDWCRVHRIRCDNSHPCSRCIERGGECTVHGKTDTRTISSPQAYRTIERLEQRVRELEQELEHHRNPTVPGGSSRASPRTPASRHLSTPGADDTLELPINEQIDRSGVAVHEGIRIRTAQSQYETWYGPGSLYYFIRRVNDFVNSTLRQSRPINRMLPDSETTLFDEPAQSGVGSHNSPAAPAVGNGSVTAGDALTPTQEEYVSCALIYCPCFTPFLCS